MPAETSPLPAGFPKLGFGLGLRAKHYPYIWEHLPPVDWFEIISENFMDTDGRPKRNLARIKEHYPIVMHGVSLSIGTADPLHSEYLQKLKALIKWVNPLGVSDHLCWTGTAHQNSHDLLPVPYTESSLKHLIRRVKEVQDFLERPIALENPSTYLEFNYSSMPEAEFIARLAEDSGCNLLLDVNNVYVTCYNHRLDPFAYINTLPLDKAVQIHLAGHRHKGTHIIDTHDSPVIDEVTQLYRYTVGRAGRVPPTMIERDDNIPEFPELFAELETLKQAAAEALTSPPPAKAYAGREPQTGEKHEPSAQETQHLMMRAVTEGARFDSAPQLWILPKQDFSPKSQLQVYINAYAARLHDVTAEDYPVLKYYLGEKTFNQLIDEFVASEISDHFNIARFAYKTPAFVKRARPTERFLHELCELETALARTASLAETEPLRQEHLASFTQETLLSQTLKPRAALELHAFDYPVNRYYINVMEERAPAPPAPEPSFTAIFRHEDIVWRMDLEEGEYGLLQRLFAGTTIGEAMAELEESAAPDISRWFSRWITNGLLAA